MKKITLSKKTKAYIEHYVYVTAGAAFSLAVEDWHAHKSYKSVVLAFAAGLVGPALAKINTKSLVNSIAKDTNIPAPLVQTVVTTAVDDATKAVDTAETK
jgi:H+/Cl- antiporter ClcA